MESFALLQGWVQDEGKVACLTLAGAIALVQIFRSHFSFRKVIVGLLDLNRRFNLLLLRLQGTTEEDAAARRILDGVAWSEFCDTLKAAGAALVSAGTPRDAFNQGYRVVFSLRGFILFSQNT